MRIAIASDHADTSSRSTSRAQLAAAGHDVVDVGPDSDESVDYPRYDRRARGTARRRRRRERGVL